MSIKTETIRTDNFSMDFFRFGRGARTLVILPGLSVKRVTDSADTVAQQYVSMTEEFTIYVFERRNDLPEIYTVRDMARDTAEAIRALGLRDICLFGASQGGMMAMVIAADNPDLVSRLALGSTSSYLEEERCVALDHWLTLARERRSEELFRSFGDLIYTPEMFHLIEPIFIKAAESVTDDDLDRFVIIGGGAKGFDARDDLDKISCPVLVLGANDDKVLGVEASLFIAEKLSGKPGFSMHIYEDGYGHAAYDTAPDYRKRLMNFFAGVTGYETEKAGL